MVAASPSPIGVDIERVMDGPLDPALEKAFLSTAERRRIALEYMDDRDGDACIARTLLWTRKEALIKLGSLSLLGMAACDLSRMPLPRRWQGGSGFMRDGTRHWLQWRARGAPLLGSAVGESPFSCLAELNEEGVFLQRMQPMFTD